MKFPILSSSVYKYLKDLEAHISSNETNFFLYRNGSSPTSEPTNPSTPSNWQAVAPPISKSTETIASSWTGSGYHLRSSYIEDSDYRHQTAPIASPQLGRFYERGCDDHHNSFLRNGKIVNDIDDTNISNTKLGFVSIPGVAKHVTAHVNASMDTTIKTQRSRSLTTTTEILSPEKPRRYSTSGIPLISDKSVSICNIGQWLKSLRLHKYIYLFSQKTYEQMLEITEENLMNVTKGARHKLVNCIQKLKERYGVLCQIEKDLHCGQITMGKALEELSNIVLTPMKPIEPFNKQDVASQFFIVLELGEYIDLIHLVWRSYSFFLKIFNSISTLLKA